LAQAVSKTAIIERRYIGGDVHQLWRTPTNDVSIAPASLISRGRATDFGVHHGEVTVNMRESANAKATRRRRVSRQRTQKYQANPEPIGSRAMPRFIGPHKIEVQINEGSIQSLTGRQGFHQYRRSSRPAEN